MTQEALKLALDALENHTAIKHPQQIHYRDKAITAIKEALAQPEPSEKFCDSNCVWTDHHPDCKLAQTQEPKIGCVNHDCDKCKAQTQEPVAHWSDCAVHSEPAYPKGECDCGGIVAVADYTALSDKYVALSDKYVALKAQRTEQNFCPRCGKRTADLTTIHTCTPPQD